MKIDSTHPMTGKVCLVTGAASGIGAVTAQELARQGAAVVLVDHNTEKGVTTTARIQAQTGNASVRFFQADLSSQQEIRDLAHRFQASYPRLDVLVNNAGAMFPQRQESVDGIEMTFALNYLGYFLLTHLLLDTLKSSAPTRIVNVSSRSHARARINSAQVTPAYAPTNTLNLPLSSLPMNWLAGWQERASPPTCCIQVWWQPTLLPTAAGLLDCWSGCFVLPF